jgi:hypothetical protein
MDNQEKKFRDFLKSSKEFEEGNELRELKDELGYIRDMADEMLEILDSNEPLEKSFYAYERFLRFNSLSKSGIKIDKLTEQLMMAKKYRRYISEILEGGNDE